MQVANPGFNEGYSICEKIFCVLFFHKQNLHTVGLTGPPEAEEVFVPGGNVIKLRTSYPKRELFE